LLAGCVAESSEFQIRAVSRSGMDEAAVNPRETVAPAVVIVLLSLREQIRTVTRVGECEEQLAHGEFKCRARGGSGECPEGSPIVCQLSNIRHFLAELKSMLSAT
jgi:hypothetical protein